MIKLTTQLNTFETTQFSHPAQTGTNFVLYTFTHNFNADPDQVLPMVLNGSRWVPCITLDTDGSNYYGYDTQTPTPPANRNQSSLRIHNIGPTLTMKVVFLKYK